MSQSSKEDAMQVRRDLRDAKDIIERSKVYAKDYVKDPELAKQLGDISENIEKSRDYISSKLKG